MKTHTWKTLTRLNDKEEQENKSFLFNTGSLRLHKCLDTNTVALDVPLFNILSVNKVVTCTYYFT